MAEKSHLSEKAVRYIEALSRARCDAQWSEVPELARKIEKHAPMKNCLATAARTEAAFESALAAALRGGNGPTGIRHAIETILLSIRDQKATPEEVFQARTCIQWLHWLDGEWDQAILCIAPGAISALESEGRGKLAEWTEVCMIKSAFIHGACLEAKGKVQEAISIYQDKVAMVVSAPASARESPQHKLWAERLLNRYARLSEPSAEHAGARSDALIDSLEAFRTWSRLGPKQLARSGMTTGGFAHEDQLSRRQTWMSYYKLLSVLVDRLSNPRLSHLHAGDIAIPSRLELFKEVQRVEAVYHEILIKETSFPQAHEYNHQVDEWTDLAMVNWAVFVGPAWTIEDISSGGKRGVSTRMLDILYQAATRTFHSMTVLRHLSVVYRSLGEFRLAIKSLDSYVTIGTKAKARAHKSGEVGPGVDSDDVYVSAISAGIEMLCVFGERKEAIKAQELSTILRQMLDEDTSIQSPTSPRGPQQSDQEKLSQNHVQVSVNSRTLSLAHRAIGISFARWSFLTYEPAKRDNLQQQALLYLKKALRGSPRNETNLEALYALSLIAAETRETQGALVAVKQALLQFTSPDHSARSSTIDTTPTPLRPSTSVVRCWHLLSLLLASRQDYDNAADSCDEALAVLGKRLEMPQLSANLDMAEKRSIISIRMTRIALRELLEGSETAVNESTTLLTLYGEMFKAKPKEETKSSEHLHAPAAIPGRTLSLRGGVFGRGRTDRTSHVGTNSQDSKSARRFSESSARQAPMLNVPEVPSSNEERPTTSRTQRSLSRSGSKKLQKRPSKRSVNRASTVKQQPTTEGGETATGAENVNQGAVTVAPPHLAPVEIGNNLQNEVGADESSALAESEEPRKTIVSCLTVHFSDFEEQRRAQEVLIEIWVFIAGLYRRAGLYSDCASACNESLKQVRSLEASVAAVRATADELARPGWGGSKSVEELKADALAERGHLELLILGARSAKENYESALTHYPDHVGATVGLSNLLLDLYSGETTTKVVSTAEPSAAFDLSAPNTSTPVLAIVPGVGDDVAKVNGEDNDWTDEDRPRKSFASSKRAGQRKSSTLPEDLDKLAARDRAFNLLSALSKLGTGWDQSEVWFALARAYELSGQLDKAQEALWWVVELEKKRPIRHWGCLGQGYSLWY